MSFFLLPSGIASSSPLIKEHERAQFEDAHLLLETVKAQADAMDVEVDAAREQASKDGFAQGLVEAEACITSEIGKFAEALSAIRTEHEARVAEAAFAAVTAIIGTVDDSEIVNRIVTTQLATRAETDGLRISVAPQMAASLSDQISSYEGCEVVADPDLAATACRLTTGDGRIVADLSLQLETLRQRWGLDLTSEESDA
jgi:flagellar biosynthesis/type III secretory pathway protein FliH